MIKDSLVYIIHLATVCSALLRDVHLTFVHLMPYFRLKGPYRQSTVVSRKINAIKLEWNFLKRAPRFFGQFKIPTLFSVWNRVGKNDRIDDNLKNRYMCADKNCCVFLFPLVLMTWVLDCPSSKGNHAPPQKFEKPNGKNTKSKFFFKLVQNWCPLSHLKALWSEFFEVFDRLTSKA